MLKSQFSNALLFTGTSHPTLALEIADYLGLSVGQIEIETFPDGEISVQILESVRGKEVFLVQSVAVKPNLYLMELLVMIDAFKRASAKSINVVIPYYGYCRQDRKDRPRAPITAKLVANLLETAGATRVLTMDLHAEQVQGFFDIPVDNLPARPQLVAAVRGEGVEKGVVVAPDTGSVQRARAYAQQLGVHFAFVDKRRTSSRAVEVSCVIGDVADCDVLIVDDICSTGQTLVAAANACIDAGARRVWVAVTHSLMVEDALESILNSPIEKLFVSNTIPQREEVLAAGKVYQATAAPIFAEAIRCVLEAKSISSLVEVMGHPLSSAI